MSDEPDISDVPFHAPSDLINIHPTSPPVKGYRDLTQAEVDLINEIKTKGDEVGELIARVRSTGGFDEHLTALAEDKLKIGTMLLVRAVARPTGF